MEISYVRKATKGDWSCISNVSRRSGYSDYINEIGEKYLDMGETIVYDKEGIHGFLKSQLMPDNSVYLSGLRVDPESRRQGIGEMLTNSMISESRMKGVTRARILVEPSNVASLSLAHKMRFKDIEQFHFYLGSIDTGGFKEFGEWPERVVDLGFEYSLPVTDFPATLLKSGHNLVSVSNTIPVWDNHAYTIMGKGPFIFEEGESLISVPEEFMSDSLKNLKPVEGFETAILLEKAIV